MFVRFFLLVGFILLFTDWVDEDGLANSLEMLVPCFLVLHVIIVFSIDWVAKDQDIVMAFTKMFYYDLENNVIKSVNSS